MNYTTSSSTTNSHFSTKKVRGALRQKLSDDWCAGMPTYTIRSYYWTICDEAQDHDSERTKRLLFHLQTGDYLATLSTIMGLLGDALDSHIQKNEPPLPKYVSMLEDIRKDLYYVHKNYILKTKDGDN